MIRKILTYYAGRLDEYLPEGVATVGLIGTAAEETPNKLVVSLVNLEKEATGDSVYMRSTSGNYAGTLAPLLLNMHIMLAAVYESKRYAESLSVLSDTLEFIQSMPRFETEGHRYTVELVPMSTMDLHNIWTTMGGQYHPSVICKVRGLVIDSGTLVGQHGGAGRYSRELYARVPRSGTQVGIPAGDAHGRQVRHGRPADRGIWRKTDRRRQHFPQACTAEKPSSAAGRRVP